jgi:ParB family chromosome partitioning protein
MGVDQGDPRSRIWLHGAIRARASEVPAELAAEIERIEQRLGELEDVDPDAWTAELAAEAEQLDDRRNEIDETIAGLAVYSDKDRARAGCIVTIGEHGDFCLHQGLVERSPIRGEAAAHAGEPGDDGDEAPASAPSEDEDDDPSPRPSSASAEQAVRKECGFSQMLVDDLKAHRLQIARAHLAGDFGVAFDLALYSLCVDLFERFGYRSHPLDLRAAESELRSSLNDLSGTPADRLLEARRQALDLDWLKLPPAEGFQALSALPAAAKRRLFAWCIASCLKPQLAIEDRADPVVEFAVGRLAIPFADYWRPTGANYWGRVRKAHGLAIAKAILGPRWERDHADAKKPILAAALEKAFDPADNTAAIGLDRAARDGAAAWLPPGIAYAEDRGDGADPQSGAAADVDEFEAKPPRSTRRTPSCLPSLPRMTRPASRSTALRHPDAHFRNGDRAPAGARYLGFIPSFADWMRTIRPLPWMRPPAASKTGLRLKRRRQK